MVDVWAEVLWDLGGRGEVRGGGGGRAVAQADVSGVIVCVGVVGVGGDSWEVTRQYGCSVHDGAVGCLQEIGG